ncbi:hypothetical protein SEA_ZUKO_42 [Streptomyces phage Zuko]|uniref:Uncharacterized protein n=1 Tax=Streptomyces phage Zuko TaxID=2601695 RepID=A0A5J6D708_9CAUD|nr:hypothetical protein PP630_gp042 [Streptomyces phage Zuko]QEQ93620.1 hypothetical protein SEA_ZUKO_42 [Streptomyces phage Zuko]
MGTDPYRLTPENMQAARLELEWKNFGLQMMIDMDLMLEPEFMIRQDGYDFMRDQIRMAMRMKVLTDNLPPETVKSSTEVVFHEPASTWQMWKRNNQGRWYTKWWLAKWLERWPVKTREVKKLAHATLSLERFRAYPEAQYRASDFRLGRAVLMHAVSPVEWWKDENPESTL